MQDKDSTKVIIACDESGNEGENLSRAGSSVFAHASVKLTDADAARIMSQVRSRTGSQAREIKSAQVLDEENEDVLEWLLSDGSVVENASVHLTEKKYFLCGKIIDLIVETIMFERGVNLHETGKAREMASIIYRDARDQLGESWDEAMDQFNTMLRTRVRNGKKATLEDFYSTLELVRPLSTGKLAIILRLVHAGEEEAAELVRDTDQNAEFYLRLDPLFAAIGQTARTWYERTGRPVFIVHDQTSLITPPRIAAIREGLADPSIVAAGIPAVVLRDVILVDSAKDSRVQVADLIAGAARSMAIQALSGTTHPLVSKLRPLIDTGSIWGHDPSWKILLGETAPARMDGSV